LAKKVVARFQDFAFLTQNFILAAQSFQFGGGIFLARRQSAYRSDDPGCGRSSEPTSIAQFPDLPLSHAASGRSYAQAAQLHPQIPA